jgi:GH25 family lysozyme M1 (1,4-beta-N-acetylmuramidase)
LIIDISHHQNPAKMNYDKLAKQVKWVIIRTQYGSRTIDKHYKTHHREFRKRGIPTAAYAWVRGVSINDMKVEARDFYNRTKQFNPTFWFLDVEEESMKDMKAGVSAYVNELRRLGVEKIGIYVAHHLYKDFNLNLDEVEAVWIPHYGRNIGKVDSKPDFPCDLHQYTSKGRLDGYSGNLDLNRIISNKPLGYFIGREVITEEKKEDEPSSWAKKAWDWVHKKGIIVGDRPKEPLTREEAAVIVYNLFNNDIEVSDWAKKYWELAAQNKIVDGKRPQAVMTRQEMAKVALDILSAGGDK